MLLCLLKKKFKVFNTLIVCRYVTVFLIQFVYSYFWGVGGGIIIGLVKNYLVLKIKSFDTLIYLYFHKHMFWR